MNHLKSLCHFTACVLMGFTSSYWQLVLLRMMISMGESVCRPMSSALIADLFTASARGVANGVFSLGVYLGFGLAFVLGINLTQVEKWFLVLRNTISYFRLIFLALAGGLPMSLRELQACLWQD